LVLINKSKDLYEKANKILTGFDNILKFYKFLTKYKELDEKVNKNDLQY